MKMLLVLENSELLGITDMIQKCVHDNKPCCANSRLTALKELFGYKMLGLYLLDATPARLA